MPPRRTPLRRKAIKRVRLAAAVRAQILRGRCVYGDAGNCEGRLQVEHVIPIALRRVHKIAHDDETRLVAACKSHNVRKATRRLYPPGFDVSLLVGAGWQEWTGGALPEPLRVRRARVVAA